MELSRLITLLPRRLEMYQFVVIAIAAVEIYFGLAKYIKRAAGQTLLKLAVRMAVWGGMGLVALYPRLTDELAQTVGIEGNVNAVILVGFLLVFLIIFKILAVVERIEQDISVLTRKDALKELERK